MRSRWKRIRYRLEWLGLVLATKLIPLCSRTVCYHIAQAVGALLSCVDRPRSQVALSNLEVAFGDRFSPKERRKIARESFQHFARTMLDLLWSPRLTQENFPQYIDLENSEETARDTGPERSLMIACYHYSNFEWLSLACGFLDLKGTIISQEFKNSSLDPIFKRLRERSGHELAAMAFERYDSVDWTTDLGIRYEIPYRRVALTLAADATNVLDASEFRLWARIRR